MTRLTQVASWVIVLSILIGYSGIAKSQSAMSFIALGDTPYSTKENTRIKDTLSQAIKDANPPLWFIMAILKAGAKPVRKSC